ncbi:MAG: hypothetical protein ACO3JZ_02095 [Schleiferiaceae bacterium]
MRKFIEISGYIGFSALALSVVFKFLHWIGAPTLLLIGTVSTSLFIVLWTIEKIRKHS